MCSYTNRTSLLNSMAQGLYSPKKELFSNICQTTSDLELQNMCNNRLLSDYTNFTDCPNGGSFVTKVGDNQNLYVLDSNQNEVDKVILNLPSSDYNRDIQGIAYDPDLSKIYIAHNDKVFSVNNQGDFIKNELNEQTLNSISNMTLSSTNRSSCGRIISTSSTSPDINALGIADNNLLVTYQKGGSNFLAKVTPNGNLVNNRHIDDGVVPSTIMETYNGIHVLATKDNSYDYLYTFDKNINRKNCCEIILDGECRVDIECEDGPCNLDGSLCEVVRSVALIENALAKLINCESDKVKAAINKAKCTRELVEINNSVSRTITNISMLEQTLKEKLEVALEIYEKRHPDCECHHCKYEKNSN